MSLLTWGWNQNSQLGHGDSETRVVPQEVTSFENSCPVQVCCGSRFTVALTRKGNVLTWGRGDDYQLGLMKGASLSTVPRLVQSLESVTVVAVAARGSHCLALSMQGQVFSWGRNDEGQLGNGSRKSTKAPAVVQSLLDKGVTVTGIACGRVHSVAISSDRLLYTWGDNDDGATGQGREGCVLIPTLLAGMRHVEKVACGSRHTLVVVSDPHRATGGGGFQKGLINQLFAFGWGTYGQLGLGDRISRDGPVEVTFPEMMRQSATIRVKGISCGYRHSLVILKFSNDRNNFSSVDTMESEYSSLWAWGWNQYGQLGVTTESNIATQPKLVTSVTGSVDTVAGGGRHTLIITSRASDGARRMYSFGRNDDGQLGLGVTFSEQVAPARVRCFGVDVFAISAGWSHSACLLQERGAAEEPGGIASGDERKAGELSAIHRSPSTQWLADRRKLLGGSDSLFGTPTNVGGDAIASTRSSLSHIRRFIETVFTAGNMDAGFGQSLNTLILVLNVLSSLGVRVGIKQNVVIDKIVPGATATVFLSNMLYGAWADRLTRSNGEANSANEFTALPHGISTVLFFAFVMLIMAPVFQKTGDAELAYRTGLASSFLLGLFELPCLFLVDSIRRMVPRAAMMSAMAGVSLTFIAMTFTVQIFSNPAVAILPLMVIFVCYGSNLTLPYKIPAGLLALVLGSIIVAGANHLGIQLSDPASEVHGSDVEVDMNKHLFLPTSTMPEVFHALADPRTWNYITVVIPLLIVNIVNNMSCIEGARAVGDAYSTKKGLALDAIVTIIGALMGNPFPTCIYIGHSAFKSMGATGGYAYLAAVASLLLGITNGASAVMTVVPEVAGVGVLMWVGIVVTAQSFERDEDYINEASGSKNHAAAVAMGLMPALAAWCLQYIQSVLPAAGVVLTAAATSDDPNAAEVHVPFDQVMMALETSGVYVFGLISLSRGYLLSSIFLSSTLVEIIDRKFYNAALWMCLASALSFVGAVHSFELDPFGVSSSYGFPARTEGNFPIKYCFAYASAAMLLMLFDLRETGTSFGSVAQAGIDFIFHRAKGGLKNAKRAREVYRSFSINSHGSDNDSSLDCVVAESTPLSQSSQAAYMT